MEKTTFKSLYNDKKENDLFLQDINILDNDERFKNLSSDSKFLYGLLLQKTSLSKRYDRRDDQNRLYTVYPLGEVMLDLNCSKQTALRAMKELKDMGLVKTVKQEESNKPDMIYLVNFCS